MVSKKEITCFKILVTFFNGIKFQFQGYFIFINHHNRVHLIINKSAVYLYTIRKITNIDESTSLIRGKIIKEKYPYNEIKTVFN